MGKKKPRKKKKLPVATQPVRQPAPAASADEPDFSGLGDPSAIVMSGVTYLAGSYLVELLPKHKDWWDKTLRNHPVSEQVKEDAQLIEQDLIERSKRGPGRPPKPAEPLPHPNALPVMRAVRDYMIDHPGSVDTSRKRAFYNDGFKAFVLEMLAEGGMAHDMTAEEAADAIGVSVHTLNSWIYKRRS
jgi:hypothetical protein